MQFKIHYTKHIICIVEANSKEEAEQKFMNNEDCEVTDCELDINEIIEYEVPTN